MIWRFKCDQCGQEIKTGDDRVKVVSYKKKEGEYNSYLTKHEGDLCLNCWKKIKSGGQPRK